MNITIKTHIDNDTIVNLYRLYLTRCDSDSEKPTKKSFVTYIKDQVEMFGTNSDSLLGSLEEYDELSEDQYNRLVKWGLLHV